MTNEVAITFLDLSVALTVGIWIIVKLHGLTSVLSSSPSEQNPPKQKESIHQQSYEHGLLRRRIKLKTLKDISSIYLFRPLAIFTIVCIFSIFLNLQYLSLSQVAVATLYLFRWVCYSLLIVIVSGFDDLFKRKIIKGLVVIGFLVLVGGYAQVFLYPDLRNLYYLGWDEHLDRMFSVFLDPNFAGSFFVLYLILLSGIYLKNRSTLNVSLNAVLIGLILLTLFAIMLTYSRGAYVMLVASIVSVLYFIKQKKYIILSVLVAFLIILKFSDFNVEGKNVFRTASTEARVETMKDAIYVFSNSPLYGGGFNAYRYSQERYGLATSSPFPDHSASGTDNSLLFVLATTGVIGLISYLYLWSSVVKRILTKRSVINYHFNLIVSVSIISLFINSMFINSLFYSFIMYWMWILVGLTESSEL